MLFKPFRSEDNKMTAKEMIGLQVKTVIKQKEVVARVVGFASDVWAIIAWDGGFAKDKLTPDDVIVFDCTGYWYREVDHLIVTEAERLSAGNLLSEVGTVETPLTDYIYPAVPDELPVLPPEPEVPQFIEIL